MPLIEDSPNNKERRAWLAIFLSQSVLAAAMLEPSMEKPSKADDDTQQSRSRSSSIREEPSLQTSLMAGIRILGPSDVPCLVETSTAHGDLLFSVTIFSIGMVKLSRSMEFKTFAILVAQCLYRIPSKSSMSPPCSSTEWSSVLTPEPVMIVAAEGLNLTLLRSPPYTCGGVLNSSPTDATLGFVLMGLSHWCSPALLSRPIFAKLSPSYNHIRPRFVCLTLSPSPFIRLCRFYELGSRRLCPFPEASPCIWFLWTYISLPASIFRNYTLKYLETDFIQHPQLGIVNSLFLLQPSRTLFNCSRKNSGLLFRSPLVPVTEKNRTRSSSASQCFEPAIREAKYPSSTSQDLLIVTISKIPEPFVEVSSTHHVLACGMLLVSLCLRVYMILSFKLIAYPIFLMYVGRICSKTLYLLLPLWVE